MRHQTYHYIRSHPYMRNIYQSRKSADMTLLLIKTQDKMANTFCKVQKLASIDHYMTDLKTCTGNI